jgi:hypothetical protein
MCRVQYLRIQVRCPTPKLPLSVQHGEVDSEDSAATSRHAVECSSKSWESERAPHRLGL